MIHLVAHDVPRRVATHRRVPPDDDVALALLQRVEVHPQLSHRPDVGVFLVRQCHRATVLTGRHYDLLVRGVGAGAVPVLVSVLGAHAHAIRRAGVETLEALWLDQESGAVVR